MSSDNIVGGFSFEWFLFDNLKGLSEEQNDLSRFNCVGSRFGVYIFFDESGRAHYVGLCGKKPEQEQDMKIRIGQYFKYKHDPSNIFAKNWKCINNKPYDDFKPYIAKLQLGTLSIDGDIPISDKQKLLGDTGVLGDMERFLIHTLAPIYNHPVYRLTNDEENRFGRFVKAEVCAAVKITQDE